MIIVRYKCGNCGNFEIKITDDMKPQAKIPCPKCQSNSGMTKIIPISNSQVRCG